MKFSIAKYDPEIGKIELIKIIRELTGDDLKTSKAVVDSGETTSYDDNKWPVTELEYYFESKGIKLHSKKVTDDQLEFELKKLDLSFDDVDEILDVESMFSSTNAPIMRLIIEHWDEELSKFKIIKLLYEFTGVSLDAVKDAVENNESLLVNTKEIDIEELRKKFAAADIKMEYTQSDNDYYIIFLPHEKAAKKATERKKISNQKFIENSKNKPVGSRISDKDFLSSNDSEKKVDKIFKKLKVSGKFYVILLLFVSGITSYFYIRFIPMVLIAAAFIGWQFRRKLPNGYIPGTKYATKLVAVFFVLDVILVDILNQYLYTGFIFWADIIHSVPRMLFSPYSIMYLLISVALVSFLVYRKKNKQGFKNIPEQGKDDAKRSEDHAFSIKDMYRKKQISERPKSFNKIVRPDAYKEQRKKRRTRKKRRNLGKDKAVGHNRFKDIDNNKF